MMKFEIYLERLFFKLKGEHGGAAVFRDRRAYFSKRRRKGDRSSEITPVSEDPAAVITKTMRNPAMRMR